MMALTNATIRTTTMFFSAAPVLSRWYYLIEAAFYSSLMFSQFTDVKRKDFWQMFIHHIVTLCLMFASWFTNTVRVGSLVLVSSWPSDKGVSMQRIVLVQTRANCF